MKGSDRRSARSSIGPRCPCRSRHHDGRLPSPIEAARLVVAETLTNAAHHAGTPWRCRRRSRRGPHRRVARGARWPRRAARQRPTQLGGPGRGRRRTAHDREPRRRRQPTDRGPPVRVAVVDDGVLFRRGLVRLLQEEGIEVVAEPGDVEDLHPRARDDVPRRRRARHQDAPHVHGRGARRRSIDPARPSGDRGACPLPVRRPARGRRPPRVKAPSRSGHLEGPCHRPGRVGGCDRPDREQVAR